MTASTNNSKHKRNCIGSLAMELSRLDDDASINIVDEETIDDDHFHPSTTRNNGNSNSNSNHDSDSESEDLTLQNNSDDTEHLCEIGESLQGIMEGDSSSGSHDRAPARPPFVNRNRSYSDRFRRSSLSPVDPDLVATAADFNNTAAAAQTDVWKKRPDRKVDQSYNLMAAHESWVVYDSKEETRPKPTPPKHPRKPPTGRPTLVRNQTSLVDVFLDATSIRSKPSKGGMIRGFSRNQEFVHQNDFTETGFRPTASLSVCGWMMVLMAIAMSVMVLTPFIMDHIGSGVGKNIYENDYVYGDDSILPLEGVPKSSRLDALQYYVTYQNMTDQSQLLQQEDSPVHQALRWMANDDPAEMAIPGFDHADIGIDTVTAEHALLQRYALAVFYFSVFPQDIVDDDTNDEYDDVDTNGRRTLDDKGQRNQKTMKQDWLTEKHICEWHGVTCNDDFESVVEINLAHHNLQGTIPRELLVGWFLPYMRELVLSHNQLSGKFPQQNANKPDDRQTYLEKLVLTSNALTGTLDALLDMKHLTYLDVQENKFDGVVPESFGELFNLHTLSLSSNKLSGSIPSTIGTLTHLRVLDLRNNMFQSKVPSSLGQLSLLQRLQMNGNDFKGHIPLEVCHLVDREGDVPQLLLLESDCSTGQITCDCCTVCH